MHLSRSSFWVILPIIGAILGVVFVFGVVLIESVNAQECFSEECKDVWVSDGYWNNVWVNEDRWESVLVSDGYWSNTWVDTSHWEISWVSSGYWNTVWVSGGSWDPCWIDTSYWSWQCTLVSAGYWQTTTITDYYIAHDEIPCDPPNPLGLPCYGDWYPAPNTRDVTIWVEPVYDCGYVWVPSGYESMCWTSGGYWENVWVDTSQYESTWVSSGYWNNLWVDTSYWTSVLVSGGYWNNVWVDTSYWENQCSTQPNPLNYGNSCGDGGTIQCDGLCSNSCDDDQGDSCTSSTNSCGMTNSGIITCSGECSADEPSNSLCSAGNSPSVVPSAVTQGDNCGIASPPITFSWTFSDFDAGDTQSAYRIRINEGGSIIHNSGKISSSSQQYTTPLGTLSYNTVYSWDIKVWDTDSPSSNSSWISGPGFITPVNQYPTPSFSWLPLVPGTNETTSFNDTSLAYGGASISSWSWTFEDGLPLSSSQENPFVAFSSIGTKAVTLQVTDSSGFSCSDNTQSIEIGVPFPEWEEISPF